MMTPVKQWKTPHATSISYPIKRLLQHRYMTMFTINQSRWSHWVCKHHLNECADSSTSACIVMWRNSGSSMKIVVERTVHTYFTEKCLINCHVALAMS